MPQEPEYRDKVYDALKGEMGNSFSKSRDEFNVALDSEDGYQAKVFSALKGELGDSFGKSEDEFYSLLKKKDASPVPSENSSDVRSILDSPQDDQSGADEIDAAIKDGDVSKSPILKSLSEKSAWLAAPINFLAGAVHGSGPVMKALDGGQKMFYKGLGSIMEGSKIPEIAAAGTKLVVDQDKQDSWFKKAENAIDDYSNEKLPPRMGAEGSPYKKNIFSDLVYTAGELTDLFATLAVTPSPAIYGISQKLAVNFMATNALQTYADEGKALPTLKAAGMGLADAWMFETLGLGSKLVGGGSSKLMSGLIGNKAATVAGQSVAGGFMFTGGYAHSIARQILDNPNWKWDDEAKDQALLGGMTFLALDAPKVLGAVTSVYQQAPRSAIEAARNVKVEPEKLRKQAKEMMDEITPEMSGEEVGSRAVAATLSNNTASIKAMDKAVGERPQEYIKKVKEMDVSEAEKADMIAKIEDAALNVEYQKQLELTKDLATAGDQLKKTAKDAPQKPKDGISPEKGTETPLKEEKPSEAPKTKTEEVKEKGAEYDIRTSVINKYMKARGYFPKKVFKEIVKMEGKSGVALYEMEAADRKLRKAMKSKEGYGTARVGEKETKIVNEVLSNLGPGAEGDVLLQQLPEAVREPIAEMRQHVDALSRTLVREGVVEGDLALKFEENQGFYLTRTYKAHKDPKWNWETIPEEIKNRAVETVMGDQGLTKPQAEASLKAWLLESKGPIDMLKSGKLGSKDLGILTKRSLEKKELRDFLGEYEDPLHNYATSVFKMTNLLAKHRFLNNVSEMGKGKFFFDKPQGEFVAKLAGEASSTMAPLNGKYTTPELKEAFETFNKSESFSEFGRLYLKANSMVKFGKTIGSPQTHVRNYIANPLFHLANGRFYTKSGRTNASDLFRFNYKNAKDPAYQEYIKKLIEFGVLRDNANAGEIFGYMRDSYKDFNELDTNLERFTKSPLKKSLKKLGEWYQMEDDVHKLYAFSVEKARYEGVMRKRHPEASKAEIEDMAFDAAAEITRNTMPTYSLVPEVLKKVRRLPLVGTFVSFPAEVMRTTFNTVDLSVREMKDPTTRDVGITRFAGLLTAATITSAASTATKNMLGIGHKDDNDLRRYMASWSKNSDLVFIKPPKGGVYTYIDLGYSDPFNYIKTAVNAFINNKGDLDVAFLEASKELISPYLSEELLASKLTDVSRNSIKETGSRVYEPQDSRVKRALDKFKYLAKSVEPGAVTSAKRIVKGAQRKVEGSREYDLGEELAALGLGQRITKTDVGEGFRYKTYQYSNNLNDSVRLYTKVLRSRSPDITQRDLDKAYKNANKALESLIKEAHKDYAAGLNLGVEKKVMMKHLSNMRANQKVKNMIRTGNYRPLNKRTGRW